MSSPDTNQSVEILIVDDSATDAELTMLAVQKAHAGSVLWLPDAQEALDYLLSKGSYRERESGLPLLVLSDLHMPQMTGFAFLERARRTASLRGLPIIIVSGSADEEDIAKSYRCGATGYLPKAPEYPTFAAQIADAVHYWLRVNRFPKDWGLPKVRRSKGKH